MRLRWERDMDGVVIVTAVTSDGREAPVADFWLQPLVSSLGASREYGQELQEQFASLLVDTHNRFFTKNGGDFATQATPPGLDSTLHENAGVGTQYPPCPRVSRAAPLPDGDENAPLCASDDLGANDGTIMGLCR